MRIRTKLLALIAIPVLAIGLAAGFGFSVQSRAIGEAEDSAQTVDRSNAIFHAIVSIGAERLSTAGAELDTSPAALAEASDASIAALADHGLTELAEELANELEAARSSSTADATEAYTEINNSLFTIPGDTADRYTNATSRDAAIINRLAVESLELKETAWLEYLATEEANLTSASTLSGSFAVATMSLMHTQEFADSATIDGFLAGGDAQGMAALQNVAVDDLGEEQLSVTPDAAFAELTQFRTGWTEIIDVRTDELGREVAEQLSDAKDLRLLFTLLAVVGVVVGAGLIFTIYRSITVPLSFLLDRVGRVAKVDLPDLMTKLRDTEREAELPEADLIPVPSNDEIGELVSAFNEVQVTTYDLATEQALGRQALGEMFVNLGRRNQQLLERILATLTDLQRDEEDPDTLSSLFELDNIVTRMRRNAESLLVMAGASTPRQWNQSVDIQDAVRAAFGEVEDYQRIDIAAISPAQLQGSVVADVAHLLAELLENAINFSSSNLPVLVSGQIERNAYVINIFDQGAGMSVAELEANNARIASPPPLDQVPSKHLGLYVVGRLAARHGIVVRLGAAPGGGVLARIQLPEDLMATEDSGTPAIGAPAAVSKAVESGTPLEDRFDVDAELATLAGGHDKVDAGEPPMSDLQRRFARTSEAATTSPESEDTPLPQVDPVSTATEPEAELPTRNRGEALESSASSADLDQPRNRRETDHVTATDNSPQGAGNFSSMMTAFSSGISKGLQDSTSSDPGTTEQ